MMTCGTVSTDTTTLRYWNTIDYTSSSKTVVKGRVQHEYNVLSEQVSFAGQASNSERDDILCALVTSDPTDLAPCDRLL